MASDPQASGGSSHLMTKIIGGVFAAVIAPILVTVGSSKFQKMLETPDDAKPKAGAHAGGGSKKPHTSSRPASEKKDAPVGRTVSRVTEKSATVPTIHLFNGKDLTNFTTYLGPPQKGQPPLGRNVDPDKVFSVRDGQIRISGKVPGALETILNYDDYDLIVEYRFGEKKWPPRENQPKRSGVQFHATGPDGAINDTWMVGYRINIDEYGAGTISLGASSEHKPSLVAEVGKQETGEAKKKQTRVYYKPGATPTPIVEGSIYRLGLKTPTLTVPGPEIKPKPDWNTLECLCAGDKLTVKFNGTVVNVATKLSQSKGKIAIRSEWAEVFFRKIDVKPLPKTRP